MKRREFIGKTAAGAAAITIVPRHVLGGPGYIASSEKLNLGYIGCGKQSYTLANRITQCPEAVIAAASDVFGKKLDLFIERLSPWIHGATTPDDSSLFGTARISILFRALNLRLI